jgi:hypothetical protein
MTVDWLPAAFAASPNMDRQPMITVHCRQRHCFIVFRDGYTWVSQW